MKALFAVLCMAVGVLLFGCSDRQPATSSAPDLKNYTLTVEGTPGLQLDLLLARKTRTGALEREEMGISLPYSKTFDAVKCAAWIDHAFRGTKGDYKMELTTEGIGNSSASGSVLKGASGYSLLHDL